MLMGCGNNPVYKETILLKEIFTEETNRNHFKYLYNLFDVHYKSIYLTDLAFKKCRAYPEILSIYKVKKDQELLLSQLKEITEKKLILIPITDSQLNHSNNNSSHMKSSEEIMGQLHHELEMQKKEYKFIKNNITDKELLTHSENAIMILTKNLATLKNPNRIM